MTTNEIVTITISTLSLLVSAALGAYTFVTARFTRPRGKIKEITDCYSSSYSKKVQVRAIVENNGYYGLMVYGAELFFGKDKIATAFCGKQGFIGGQTDFLGIHIPSFFAVPIMFDFAIEDFSPYVDKTLTLKVALSLRKHKSFSFIPEQVAEHNFS